jgi:glycine betaine/proline transport system permease protein
MDIETATAGRTKPNVKRAPPPPRIELPPRDVWQEAAAEIRAGERQALIRSFVGPRAEYYETAFAAIQTAAGFPLTFNWAAAVLGPFWMAARNVWTLFWPSVLLETIAVASIARGLYRLNVADIPRAGEASAGKVLVFGLAMLLVTKIVGGLLADIALERRFMKWRSNRKLSTGINTTTAIWGGAVAALTIGLSAYPFPDPQGAMFRFPASADLRGSAARALAESIQSAAGPGTVVSAWIRQMVRSLLALFELVLVASPWPVIAMVIITLAWRWASLRAAVWTAVGLAYLLLFGFWEAGTVTVALVCTAASICVAIGLPLGIVLAKSDPAYRLARPVLDFMQTMPSFMYLIPVIALTGTGKPPSILATVIFAIPPVISMTALGLRSVPESVVEAATAFGAGAWYRLTRVELPLARPSIVTGVNQTMLMCLSMVLTASLIGAKGLGDEVLRALEHAAQGDGMLAGFAILVCAAVLDRLVRGRQGRARAWRGKRGRAGSAGRVPEAPRPAP